MAANLQRLGVYNPIREPGESMPHGILLILLGIKNGIIQLLLKPHRVHIVHRPNSLQQTAPSSAIPSRQCRL